MAACSFDPGGSLGTGDSGVRVDSGAPGADARPGAPDATPNDTDAAPTCAPPCAGDGDPCTSDDDCGPAAVCSDNPFEAPGGYCITVGCTPGNDSTCAPGGDGTCVDTDTPVCVDRCSSPGECRPGYACTSVDIGVSGCLSDHADPGSFCFGDSDCGLSPWECVHDKGFPGGYCGATGCSSDPDSCPVDTFCAMVNGETYCIRPCDPIASGFDCRFIEGYECADFGSGFFGCIDLDDLD